MLWDRLQLYLTVVQSTYYASFLTTKLDARRRYGNFARRLHDCRSDVAAQKWAHACQPAPYWTDSGRQNGSLVRVFSGYLCRRSHSVDGSQMEERREKTFLYKRLWQVLNLAPARMETCNHRAFDKTLSAIVVHSPATTTRATLSEAAFEACQHFLDA